MAQPDRRLVPIVSLDVVGYSRLAEINERQTLRLVQRVYDRLVARTIGRYGGKVFKTMGDGLLAEFQSVVAAVEWVADLQKELYERQLSAPGGSALWYLNALACPSTDACSDEAMAALDGARDAQSLAQRGVELATADQLLAASGLYVPLARPLRWSLVANRLNQFKENGRAWHPLTALVSTKN